jgi:formylglycine-generating enzyme required for sulfatase activity
MKKQLLFTTPLIFLFSTFLHSQSPEQLQKEYQMIVASREGAKVSDKEKGYASYLSLCLICRDSAEARKRLNEYNALRVEDKRLFEEARAKRSIDLYSEYLRTCFYCEDSVAAKKWMGYYTIDKAKNDTLAWKKSLSAGTEAAFKQYLTDFPEGVFRKDALKKMNLITRIENWRPDMVSLKGGQFTMGIKPVNTFDGILNVEKEGNEKVHEVKVSDFWLDKFEVSFDLYDIYCEDTNQKSPSDNNWGRRSRPAINVSWFDAVQFCNWLSGKHKLKPYYSVRQISEIDFEVLIPEPNGKGYRLPTEAEWEYAAKTSTNSTLFANATNYADPTEMNFACDKTEESFKNLVKNNTNCQKMTLPVNSHQPNALGFYNLSGNVSEWCWDGYHVEYKRANKGVEVNPKGDPSSVFKVYKGGSWFQSAFECRSSARKYIGAPNKRTFIGFRLAKNT